MRTLLLSALLAGAGLNAYSACEAPRMSQERIAALRDELGGRSFQMDPSTVILELTFDAPDAPPVVATLFAGGDKRYIEGMVTQAKLLRAPCASVGAPVKSLEMHRLGVRYAGWERYSASEPRLRGDLELAQVVRLVKDIRAQKVRFDTREMGCPFKLRFLPFRPYLPNVVEEQAPANTARAPLLEWLRGVTLDIPAEMMVTAIGRESVVSVPCLVLDLS